MLVSVHILFHRKLVPLLSRRDRASELSLCFRGDPSVKDAIEACGIPHTEVDIILVDDCSVAFDHRLQDGVNVKVYPYGSSPKVKPLIHLCPPLTGDASFILDVHLGKLARRLRMLGFDCSYSNNCDDPELIRLALDQQRIILTRDRGILKHARVRYGLLIRSGQADDQAREVLQRFQLTEQIRPFQRCTSCNGLLKPIEKEVVRHRLLPKTARYYDQFHQCDDCQKIYWKGTHYRRIADWIEWMRRDL